MRQSQRVLSIPVLPAFLALTNPAFRIYNAQWAHHSSGSPAPPRRGCSLSCPLCSALDSLSGDLTDQSTLTKHPEAHTKILLKAAQNPARTVAAEGVKADFPLAKGNEHPMHPCQSAVHGEDGSPLSHLLGTLFLPIRSLCCPRFTISCGLSSPKPQLSKCSSGLIKIIRVNTGEKHLLDLVFLVHRSARYFHLFVTPAFEFTATDASFDGKISCWASKSTGPALPLLLCGSVKETDS